jgi:hypothetical protein
MVFEESTFVLPSAPVKAKVKPAEPAIPDPSEKLETPEVSKPADATVVPKIGTMCLHCALLITCSPMTTLSEDLKVQNKMLG